ncbi:nicotinate phosphoribosyltransferase [Nitrosophilus alvini]|uniref:nicotinate phosphoribosyltransferase n=1 Tax=Nitrosophilus alvini TaxID=2714855 RepID=UPI00190A8B19|nr:nicotinate phosphoribosyltransferase [Nitrosophilus alvini]
MTFGFVNKENMSLLTDMYELTMAQVYFNENMNKTAIFDFFTREIKNRSYLLNAGLEQVLYYLENMRFTQKDIDFLKSTGKFSDDFLDFLKEFRFGGNVYAIDEGEFVFPNEPVIQVEAPLIEAQIIETFLINTMQISMLTATKAIRCYNEAKGTALVEFGLRRSHGSDAGMKAARNSYIGGFLGTSNVLAGEKFGIPIFGTMAHSFILAHETEEKAFENFAKYYPKNAILLVDTFDTIKGVENAVKTIKKMGLETFKGIRLDSGDILKLSIEARKILDEAGFSEAMIFVSGSLNEYKIKELLKNGAPVNAWGVGTELAVSADLPYLDCAYKLVEYDNKPKMKFSPGKITLPSKKQVFRKYENGVLTEDIIGFYNEKIKGEPLLKLYMEKGKIVCDMPSLNEIKQKALKNFAKLPENLKDIEKNEKFLPKISSKLQDITREFMKKHGILNPPLFF